MPAASDAVETALTVCRAAEDKKATDLTILEVADILHVVDLFVLASTSTDRQLRAVVDEIEAQVQRDQSRRPARREGEPASGWVLLDYGDVVCHLFTAEQRDFYQLERLWGDVPRRDTSTGERVPARTAVTAAAGGTDDRGT